MLEPMPIDVAATRCFPHGGVTKSQMLAAIRACNSHYEMLEALKPKLNAKTRLAVNEWVEAMEAMEAMGGKNERVIASGLRFLLEQEDKRQAVVAKAEGLT